MKKTLQLLAASLFLASVCISHGQTSGAALTPAQIQRAANVTATVNAVRQAADDEAVEQLIAAAINLDPEIASDLVAALVVAYPLTSDVLTDHVVQSVISNANTNVNQKSAILTTVAQKAVDAALAIPPSSVPDLITTVNNVKTKLRQVVDTFQTVEQYTAPLVSIQTSVEGITTATDVNGATVVVSTTPPAQTPVVSRPLITPLETQEIVSNQNP